MTNRTTRLVEVVVLTALGMLAVNAVVVHAGLATGASLAATTPAWSSLQLVVLIAALLSVWRLLRSGRDGRFDLVALAGLSAVVVLTVAGVLARPLRVGDDWGYMIRAVYAVLDPQAILSVREPGQVPPLDFPNYYNLPYTSEFFSAYVAELTGLPFLTVYHQIMRGILAALLPLVWFLAILRFADGGPRLATVAVTFIIAALFLSGPAINGFGGATLDRIWLNKGILVAILFPLGLRYLLAFLDTGRLSDWCKLALLGVVAGGLGLNALYLWPAYLAVLSAAFIAQAMWMAREHARPASADWRALLAPLPRLAWRTLLVVWSQSYLLAVVIAYHQLRDPNFGAWSGETLARSIGEQLDLVFQSPISAEFLVPGVSTFFALVLYRGRDRIFVIAWVALFGVTLLNPVFHLLVNTLTDTPLLSSFWRFLYLLPFPLVAGLIGVSIFGPAPGSLTFGRMAVVVAAASAVVATALLLPVGRVLTVGPAAQWPSPSSPEQDLAIMAAIDRQAPPGPILAAEWVGARMPVRYQNRPQILTYSQVAQHYGTWSNDRATAERRLAAGAYLRKAEPRERAAFEEVVREHRPAAVVFLADPRRRDVDNIMAELGYRRGPLPGNSFVLFVRAATP